MNAGGVWWERIGSSLRLLQAAADHLADGVDFLLRLPERMPWPGDFYDALDIRRSGSGGDRRLRRLPWRKGGEPGDLVMEELCSEEEEAEYWPGESKAAYLGSRRDILLNDYDVWITGLEERGDLKKWTDFISEYRRCCGGDGRRAVFVLECRGGQTAAPGLETVSYAVEERDCRVFALEATAELKNTEYPEYQAELALRIGGLDPELVSALLARGKALLIDPVQTALEVSRTGRSSRGEPLSAVDETTASSAAWEAALVQLFPGMERIRTGIIKSYEQELMKHLPTRNSNGDMVTDPFDLDIGPLYYILKSSGGRFKKEDVLTVSLCRSVRNLLAHNHIVPFESVKQLVALFPEK